MFHKLKLLDETRTDFRIRVRVTRMWPIFGHNGNFIGFNLILLDAEDYHIQAFVYADVWNAFQNLIFEGNSYSIRDFVVRKALGRLRPVSSPKSIVLKHSTTVSPLPLNLTTIPMHKFEVTELQALYDLANSYAADHSPEYAIDVVGVVHNFDPVTVFNSSSGERKFVRFNLYDGSNSVKVIFWDEMVSTLDPLVQGNFDVPPIIILSSMRPRICFGSVQLNSLSFSRLYINIDYEAVRRTRQRLDEEDVA